MATTPQPGPNRALMSLALRLGRLSPGGGLDRWLASRLLAERQPGASAVRPLAERLERSGQLDLALALWRHRLATDDGSLDRAKVASIRRRIAQLESQLVEPTGPAVAPAPRSPAPLIAARAKASPAAAPASARAAAGRDRKPQDPGAAARLVAQARSTPAGPKGGTRAAAGKAGLVAQALKPPASPKGETRAAAGKAGPGAQAPTPPRSAQPVARRQPRPYDTLLRQLRARPDQTDDRALLDLLKSLRDADPEDIEIFRVAFLPARTLAQSRHPDWPQAMERWWAFIDPVLPRVGTDVLDHVGAHVRKLARRALDAGDEATVETLMAPMMSRFGSEGRNRAVMAALEQHRGNWRRAAELWQLSAAASLPVTTKNGAVVAEQPEEAMRRTRSALKGLRICRTRLARELRATGPSREFSELVCRVVESLPEQRAFKKEREIVDIVARYVNDALADDGLPARAPRDPDARPRRIMFCLDVLKVSDVHNHARTLFAICQNLMEIDPEIETHLVITNERLAVTTPMMAQSFDPTRADEVYELAQTALPGLFGTRFHLHSLLSFGLEGLIDTCRRILDLDPDIVIYGGGHIGLMSNESRVVRHCLFEHVPTAFLFVQANNEVDEKFDMIIARGPHAVVGDPGAAEVRIQPYPTITRATAPAEPVIDRKRLSGKMIVSAVAGVRLDLRLAALEESVLRDLLTILDRVPGSKWHIIGSEDPKALAAALPPLAERIASRQVVLHKLMPLPKFEQSLAKAALFLQMPGFTGGSGGAGIARRAGVPILTFEHSDVSGRQPPETVFEETDIAGFTAKVVGLLSDPDEWERIARAQFEYSRALWQTAPQGYYDCLGDAVRNGRSRLAGRPAEQDPDLAPVTSVSAAGY